jgi:hypothetical protein
MVVLVAAAAKKPLAPLLPVPAIRQAHPHLKETTVEQARLIRLRQILAEVAAVAVLLLLVVLVQVLLMA